MPGLPPQNFQLAKNYGDSFLLRNQFGCNRLFLDLINLDVIGYF